MSLPRHLIRKGVYLTSGPPASADAIAHARSVEARRLEALEAEDAEYHKDRLQELDDQRKALAAKMTALKQKIDAITPKGRR